MPYYYSDIAAFFYFCLFNLKSIFEIFEINLSVYIILYFKYNAISFYFTTILTEIYAIFKGIVVICRNIVLLAAALFENIYFFFSKLKINIPKLLKYFIIYLSQANRLVLLFKLY